MLVERRAAFGAVPFRRETTMVADIPVPDELPAPLGRVRVRRVRLEQAADDLELAITGAVADGAVWRAQVAAALEEVQVALDDHVTEVESPDGLYPDIMARTPRLAHAIDRLRAEHVSMGSATAALREQVGAEGDTDVDAVREGVVDLLADISRHRHRGADLIWNSYDLDIGEGE
jgi:hypothetical protein